MTLSSKEFSVWVVKYGALAICLAISLMGIFIYRPIFNFQLVGGPSNDLFLIRKLPVSSYVKGETLALTVTDEVRIRVYQLIARHPSGAILVRDTHTNGHPQLLSPAAIQGKVIGRVEFLGLLFFVVKTHIGFLVFTFLFWLLFVWKELRGLVAVWH